MKFSPHHCKESCILNSTYGALRCQKLDNMRVSKENTRRQFISLTNNYLVGCLQILQRIGFTDKLDIDDDKK